MRRCSRGHLTVENNELNKWWVRATCSCRVAALHAASPRLNVGALGQVGRRGRRAGRAMDDDAGYEANPFDK